MQYLNVPDPGQTRIHGTGSWVVVLMNPADDEFQVAKIKLKRNTRRAAIPLVLAALVLLPIVGARDTNIFRTDQARWADILSTSAT